MINNPILVSASSSSYLDAELLPKSNSTKSLKSLSTFEKKGAIPIFKMPLSE